MANRLIYVDIIFCLYLVIQVLFTNSLSGFLCCKCSHGERFNSSYQDCVNNNTCSWSCDKPVLQTSQCGPQLFLDPAAKEGPPIVTSNFKTFNLIQDDQLQIPCKIQSNPEANVTWLFNGRRIDSYPDKLNRYTITTSDCGSVLEMRVLVSDQGEYTCLAQNVKGSGSKIFTVTVDASYRKFTNQPFVSDLRVDTEDNKAYLGTTFNLSCQIHFDTRANNISLGCFARHGVQIRDTQGRYENFLEAAVKGDLVTNKLLLKNVTMAEQGIWKCYGFQRGVKGESKSLYLRIVPCPAGYFCPWNESKKYECPYGTYSDGSTNITYQCTKCPGTYPNNKPRDNKGPARSVKECPTEGLKRKSFIYFIVGIIAIIVMVVVAVCIFFKYQSNRRQRGPYTDEFVLVKALGP